MNKEKEILNYLNEIIPNPVCELNYNKDYELLLAVMLSAQTKDARVNKVTKVLFNKYDSLKKLKEANIKDIENIIKELGNYHKKSEAVINIAKILDEKYNGKVINNRKILENLPMVGRKTTNVVLSELFNEPTIAVDTHVERVSKRLGLVKKDDDVIKIEEKLKRKFDKNIWSKLHKQFVLFGRYYCTSKKPSCNKCKLQIYCKKEF
ncbi:MAG TPA: endonuclease III [Bacilli bacterium]|nr:endonuclease III [Mycoplasma sp. CAG:611]HJJ07732.1 endonuclease III [Bacilli bacterium]